MRRWFGMIAGALMCFFSDAWLLFGLWIVIALLIVLLGVCFCWKLNEPARVGADIAIIVISLLLAVARLWMLLALFPKARQTTWPVGLPRPSWIVLSYALISGAMGLLAVGLYVVAPRSNYPLIIEAAICYCLAGGLLAIGWKLLGQPVTDRWTTSPTHPLVYADLGMHYARFLPLILCLLFVAGKLLGVL